MLSGAFRYSLKSVFLFKKNAFKPQEAMRYHMLLPILQRVG